MSEQALLVMDYQVAAVEGSGGKDRPVVLAAVSAIEAARRADIPVIFVRVAFRASYRDLSKRNRILSGAVSQWGNVFIESEATSQLHPALGVTEDDLVVTKRRVGAFASDLTSVLSGLRVSRLVLAGLGTSGAVLSTLTHASDADFEVTVLSDACSDSDQETHDVLIQKVFPAYAEVTTVAEWASSL